MASKTDGGLRTLEREHIKKCQWTSIETGASAGGVPDMEFCFPGGIQGWIENKKSAGWAIKFQPAQIGWISRRVRMGGRVFVAVRQVHAGGLRSLKRDDLWLCHGRAIEHLHDHGLSGLDERDFYHTTGGPARWDWDEVVRRIKGKWP